MTKNDADYPINQNASEDEFVEHKSMFMGLEHKSLRGTVRTPHGIAIVHACSYEGRYKSSGIEMAKDGRSYFRRIEEYYGKRKLAEEALQFAKELFR